MSDSLKIHCEISETKETIAVFASGRCEVIYKDDCNTKTMLMAMLRIAVKAVAEKLDRKFTTVRISVSDK